MLTGEGNNLIAAATTTLGKGRVALLTDGTMQPAARDGDL